MQISDIDSLLSKVNFQNDRREFDRIFYSILGLLDGQIAFGVTDKDIIGYVTNCKGLSEKAWQSVCLLISQLSAVADMNEDVIPTGYVSFKTKRAMKFFLLLAAFGFVDFTYGAKDKLKALELIDAKLSSFSSAKAGQIKNTFPDYSDKVVEEYRLLHLISSRRQPFKRVENRMKILAYYVNNPSNSLKPSGIQPV